MGFTCAETGVLVGWKWLLKSPSCSSSTFLLTLALIQFSLIQFCERCCGSRTGARTPSEHCRGILEQGDGTPTIGPYDELATHPGVYPAFARTQLGWCSRGKTSKQNRPALVKEENLLTTVKRQLFSVSRRHFSWITFKKIQNFGCWRVGFV